MKLNTIIYLCFCCITCHATLPLKLNTLAPAKDNQRKNIELNIAYEDLTDLINNIANDSILALQNFGIEVDESTNKNKLGVKGVLIKHILKNSPADQAGLQDSHLDKKGRFHLGDIIIKINQKPITNSKQLKQTMPYLKVGMPLTLTIIRNKHKIKVSLKTLNIASFNQRNFVANKSLQTYRLAQ